MARNRRDEKRRLNGFTIPVVGAGVQWEHLDTARPSARRTLTFLADRRVLFNPYWQEEAGHCVASVLEVRRFLTEEIGLLGDDVVLIPHLEAMRAACRRFLDQVSEMNDKARLWQAFHEFTDEDTRLVAGLGEMRAAIGLQVALIAAAFELDIPDNLLQTIPAMPASDDGAAPDLDLRRPW